MKKKYHLSVLYRYNLKCSLFLAILVWVISTPKKLFAQTNPFNLKIKSTAYGSTQEALPFWLYTNNDGKIARNGPNWINEFGFRADVANFRNFSADIGGNLVERVSREQNTHFSELYLHADLRGYRLSVGRFPDPIGLNNHELSVGSMMVSRNAVPIPKISLSTPEFLNLPYSNGFLRYKVMFSHGWLEENRFMKNALLHQKYAYLQVNADHFSATGGIVHNLTWGGVHPSLGRQPQSLSTFLRVIAGLNAHEKSNVPGRDTSNVIGNSIAAYEFSLTHTSERYEVSLTRLFYLEDKVSTRFRSPWDGVWGLNINFKQKNTFINNLIYEHINTKQQDAKDDEALGRANYYNNSSYKTGWIYFDHVIGLPLFRSTPGSIPYHPQGTVLYTPLSKKVNNNMIVAHHIGINGSLSGNLTYRMFLTYSRNYGKNGLRIPSGDLNLEQRRTDQYSGLIGLTYLPLGAEHLKINLSVAGDIGELYSNQPGVMFGLEWNWGQGLDL